MRISLSGGLLISSWKQQGKLARAHISIAGWLSAFCVLFSIATILASVNVTPVRPKRTLLFSETFHKKKLNGVSDANAISQAFEKSQSASKNSQLDGGPLFVKVVTKPCSAQCTITLPNIRAQNVTFWISINGTEPTRLEFEQSTAGLTFTLGESDTQNIILGELTLQNLQPISAFQTQQPTKNEPNVSDKDRFGGILYGALFTLAIFSTVISLLNRDISFLVLAGWLITTCRLVAFNSGWDLYWLGLYELVPFQVVLSKISLIFHALISTALFFVILDQHLKAWPVYFLCAISAILVLLIPLSYLIKTSTFFFTFWSLAAVSLICSQAIAISTALREKHLHIVLFAASWFLVFLGAIADILFSADLLRSKIPLLNVQTGAIASALIMSIAIADRMRRERLGRLAAQRSLTGIFKKFKALYRNVPLGLCNLDQKFVITEHNSQLANMLEMSTETSLRGRCILDFFPQDRAILKIALSNKDLSQVELKVALSARSVWFRVNFKTQNQFIDCAFEDITARVESEQKLQYLSKHDPLTGCKNRYEFEKDLMALLNLPAVRLKSSIAHVDIKKFKLINDLFGHAIGDQMLAQVARRLTGFVNSKCALYRLDGDDFFMVFTDTDGSVVEHICGRIQEALSVQHYIVNMRAMSLEAGIGIVHLTDNISATDVFASATGASDSAKERSDTKVVAVGRGSHDLKQQIEERHLMATMKEKFPEDRLFLDAQPIVNLRDPGKSLAYEVLVRLRGENGGVIAPGQFIPAAEKNGLMSQVDRWVLNHLLVWLEHHPEHAQLTDFITVNLSGASMNDLRFAEDALAMVKEHRHLASKICFEITESVALLDLRTTLRFVEQTKSFGCKLALDDFGAGYTSFKYLKDIPSDIVKIDGSYVRTINQSTSNHAIVKAISDLTHEMGMMCVAEWIEDVATVKTLRRLGMDYGQGFALCKPKGLDDIVGRKSGFETLTEKPVIDFYQEVFRGSALKAVPREIILSAV
jgi:diguanylate cyclase (GGDEF)-like protein